MSECQCEKLTIQTVIQQVMTNPKEFRDTVCKSCSYIEQCDIDWSWIKMNKRLKDALGFLQSAYPSVFDSVVDTLVAVVEQTMDTIFIEFVDDLITRYKDLDDDYKWMKYEEKDFRVE